MLSKVKSALRYVLVYALVVGALGLGVAFGLQGQKLHAFGAILLGGAAALGYPPPRFRSVTGELPAEIADHILDFITADDAEPTVSRPAIAQELCSRPTIIADSRPEPGHRVLFHDPKTGDERPAWAAHVHETDPVPGRNDTDINPDLTLAVLEENGTFTTRYGVPYGRGDFGRWSRCDAFPVNESPVVPSYLARLKSLHES